MSNHIFFFNDTATTEIYTLSLHDALPIYIGALAVVNDGSGTIGGSTPLALVARCGSTNRSDRKSTRLNSSHSQISYAVFCLKKKSDQRSTATCTLRTSHMPILAGYIAA